MLRVRLVMAVCHKQPLPGQGALSPLVPSQSSHRWAMPCWHHTSTLLQSWYCSCTSALEAWCAPSPHSFPQGPPYLLVAETVDEGVQHGGDDAVQCGDQCIGCQGVAGAWPVVVQISCHKVQGDHEQVGRACGEGLVPVGGHRHPENGGQDAEVGNYNKKKGAEAHKDTGSVECHFAGASVAARGPQQWGDITEDVLELDSPAEGQPGGEESVHGRVQHPPEPAAGGSRHTDSLAHGMGVAQGLAYGCVAVVGHDSQECALSPCAPHQEEHLCQASVVGDGHLWAQDICQDLGHRH